MTTNVYPKSTTEFIAMPVTKNGVVQTAGVGYSVVLQPGPEGTHTPADVFDGETGVMIANLVPGTYKVWASVSTAGTGTAESPHIPLGSFRITA